MTQDPLEQLKRLSQTIREEEISLLAEGLTDDSKEFLSSQEIRRQREKETYALLLLRSLRIHLCLELLEQGYSACLSRFQNDWKEIMDCLKFIEGERDPSDALLSDGLQTVLLLDPGKKDALRRQLASSFRLSIPAPKAMSFSVFSCALEMAEYCMETHRTTPACRIISNLISLSEESHAADFRKHRMIVVQALPYIVDIDHQFTAEICEKQRRYFDGTADTHACSFFWFYAFSLLNIGREEDSIPLLKHCYDLCMQVEGETSWTGVRAGTLYFYYVLLSDHSPSAEQYLWDVLEKLDKGFYMGMDDSADYVGAYTRSVLLRFHMDSQTLRGLLPVIQRFKEYCVSQEDTSANPHLTIRFAENILSGYYFESGDYLQAADHALNALNSIPPNHLPKDPSDILLYSNLLLIYICLNDFDQMAHYAQVLMDLSDEYEDDDYMSARVSIPIDTAAKKLQVDPEVLDDDRQSLENSTGKCARASWNRQAPPRRMSPSPTGS